MVKYESEIKRSEYSAQEIYNFVSDFTKFEHLVPKDKVKDWQCTSEACSFTVDKIGNIGIRIVDKEPNKTIKFSSDGKVSFNFFMWIQLKEVSENDTRIKLSLHADLNMMMKMMAGKYIKGFLNMLATSIADYNYSEQDAS